MTAPLLLLLACAAATPVSPEGPPLFSRPEPHLKRGAELLRADETDAALEAFRNAGPKTADERAMVEYDVGHALLRQAELAAKAAPEAGGGPPKLDASDARAALDRAFGLATHPALKSEAALASGNAAALAGELDDAIAQFRKALVADPTNARARTNLRRVLDAKRAQPPQEPQGGGDEQQEGDKKDDDKKEEEKEEKQDDKQKQKEGEKKEPQPGEKKEDPKDAQGQSGNDEKDDEKDDEEDEKKDGQKDGQKDEQREQRKDEAEPPPGQDRPTPKQLKKEQARRLLDAMRSREKPLSPLQMRGTTQQRPSNGKDW
jgi:hypothetical protein